MSTVKHVLKTAEKYKLMQLTEAEYSVRKENDVDFAKYAGEKLGFAVNDNHIKGVRYALGIEPTRSVTSSGALETRVTLLEKRLAELEDRYNSHTRNETIHSRERKFGDPVWPLGQGGPR